MVSVFTNEMFNGQLRQIQNITYSNGIKSKRVFAQPGDSVPMEVIWIHPENSVKVTKKDVIEHREVQLYNHYFPSLHVKH